MATITITAEAYFALEDEATNGIIGGARQNPDATWTAEVDQEVLERLERLVPPAGDPVRDHSAAILKALATYRSAR